MDFSEEDIKRAAQTKEWIESRIAKLEDEASRLNELLTLLDMILRKTSFKPASSIPIISTQAPIKQEISQAPKPLRSSSKTASKTEFKEIRSLKRASDGKPLANAYISDSSVGIVPVSDVPVNTSTPPFTSYFLKKVLDVMVSKDMEIASSGGLEKEDVLNYKVDEESGVIKKIIINNYRDQSRLTEILNLTVWTITRMLEKAK